MQPMGVPNAELRVYFVSDSATPSKMNPEGKETEEKDKCLDVQWPALQLIHAILEARPRK